MPRGFTYPGGRRTARRSLRASRVSRRRPRPGDQPQLQLDRDRPAEAGRVARASGEPDERVGGRARRPVPRLGEGHPRPTWSACTSTWSGGQVLDADAAGRRRARPVHRLRERGEPACWPAPPCAGPEMAVRAALGASRGADRARPAGGGRRALARQRRARHAARLGRACRRSWPGCRRASRAWRASRSTSGSWLPRSPPPSPPASASACVLPCSRRGRTCPRRSRTPRARPRPAQAVIACAARWSSRSGARGGAGRRRGPLHRQFREAHADRSRLRLPACAGRQRRPPVRAGQLDEAFARGAVYMTRCSRPFAACRASRPPRPSSGALPLSGSWNNTYVTASRTRQADGHGHGARATVGDARILPAAARPAPARAALERRRPREHAAGHRHQPGGGAQVLARRGRPRATPHHAPSGAPGGRHRG